MCATRNCAESIEVTETNNQISRNFREISFWEFLKHWSLGFQDSLY